MKATISLYQIKKIIAAEHHDPFAVLGMHEAASGGGLQAEPVPCHGRPCSLNMSLFPLSCLIFKPEV